MIFEGHPSWRAILDFYIKGFALTALIAFLVAIVTKLFADDGIKTGAVVAIALVGVGLTVLIGFVRRVATRYTITNRRLHIKRGIVSRIVQESRLERVQDVTYSQSALQRVLGIGDVDFDTAADGDDLMFAGVDDPADVVDQVHRATQASGAGLGERH